MECVLPQDQQIMENEWKTQKLEEKHKRKEAAHKRAQMANISNNLHGGGGLMTHRIEPIGLSNNNTNMR